MSAPGTPADLVEHLQRARQVLRIPPSEPPSEGGPPLSRVLAVAEAALERLAASATERRLPHGGPPRIGLARRGHRVIVLTAGASEEDVAAFIAALRRDDRRLLDCAELIGHLLGLGAIWAASGFAPPVVLTSLRREAPRIVALGRDLLLDHRSIPTATSG